jgi:hypothetical protein
MNSPLSLLMHSSGFLKKNFCCCCCCARRQPQRLINPLFFFFTHHLSYICLKRPQKSFRTTNVIMALFFFFFFFLTQSSPSSPHILCHLAPHCLMGEWHQRTNASFTICKKKSNKIITVQKSFGFFDIASYSQDHQNKMCMCIRLFFKYPLLHCMNSPTLL